MPPKRPSHEYGATDHMFEMPALVRQKSANLGQVGERWLAALPDLVADLRHRWSINPVAALSGGSASCVLRVRTGDGGEAVLKLAMPETGFDDQVRTLADAHGHGYAHLLAADAERHAMLLELCGPSMDQLTLPPELAIENLCHTLAQAWTVPRPSGAAVDPEQEKATRLARFVRDTWDRLGHPCSEAAVATALRFAERRAAAFDLDRCVVVHGDPHPGNALRAAASRPGAESGFVFVDPDGFLAEPAYDLGVVLRDWCPQLLAGDAKPVARRYCALLAEHSGVDETAIWEWGFLERVSTGLFVLAFGAEDVARPFLETAELLL
ncbi:streptomycin 6-kinase [Catenulispora sp. EB89]